MDLFTLPMERLDHPIGEPVGEGVKRTRIGRSYPNAPIGSKLPAFYLRRLLTMVATMGIALVLVSVFLFPVLIFMPFMCLIMPIALFGCLIIAFPIAMIIIQTRMKDIRRNETVLTKEGIHVRSAYAIGNPTTIVDIPFDNIVHVSKLTRDRWNERSLTSTDP